MNEKINPSLNPLIVDISGLTPDPKNPRLHSDQNITAIKNSLSRFGQQKPIVISKDQIVIAGNGTFESAKQLGWTKIAVLVFDQEGDKASEGFRLADNRTAELAEWDHDLLIESINDCRDQFDPDLLGWNSKDLSKLLDSVEPEEETSPVPEMPKEAKAKLGLVYYLGRHRLMCGDSTNVEDVERLMDGKKADMVFTDPPYGVNFMSRKDKKHPFDYTSKPYRDDFSKDEFLKFSKVIFDMMECHLKEGGVFYLWGADRSIVAYYHFESKEMLFHKIIVWDKDWSFLNRKDLLAQNEFCIYGWKRGENRKFNRMNYSDIWKVKKINPNKMEHSTQKPTELIVMALNMSSDRDDYVLDLFLGSGSTLIACQQLDRICYGMEIDPRYCDVVIERYCNLMQIDPNLVYGQGEKL